MWLTNKNIYSDSPHDSTFYYVKTRLIIAVQSSPPILPPIDRLPPIVLNMFFLGYIRLPSPPFFASPESGGIGGSTVLTFACDSCRFPDWIWSQWLETYHIWLGWHMCYHLGWVWNVWPVKITKKGGGFLTISQNQKTFAFGTFLINH